MSCVENFADGWLLQRSTDSGRSDRSWSDGKMPSSDMGDRSVLAATMVCKEAYADVGTASAASDMTVAGWLNNNTCG